jgi:DNA-binding IclR family transcriptional regulator
LIPNTIRQKDLAALAGLTRETVNRALAEWESCGIAARPMHAYLSPDPSILEHELAKTDH